MQVDVRAIGVARAVFSLAHTGVLVIYVINSLFFKKSECFANIVLVGHVYRLELKRNTFNH
jgi:hypothetical protein